MNQRVAVVTGGSRGIGAKIVETLADAGYQVASLSGSGKTAHGLGIACNVADRSEVDEAFKQIESELGPVEVLVANAGITRDGLAARMSEENWQEVIDVNLTGAYHVIQRSLRGMMKARFGRIVLMGSVAGTMGTPGQLNYAASKGGLIGMARSLTRELAGRGITCNVVTPGFIETDMTDALSDEVKAQYAAQIPVGRMGTTEDVANAVKFLVNDKTSYITGAVIPVDGGVGMGH